MSLCCPPACCPAPLPAPAPAASSTHACGEALPQGSGDTVATSWRIQPRLTSLSLSALHCHSPKSQIGSPLPRRQQPTLGTLPVLLSMSGAPDREGRVDLESCVLQDRLLHHLPKHGCAATQSHNWPGDPVTCTLELVSAAAGATPWGQPSTSTAGDGSGSGSRS